MSFTLTETRTFSIGAESFVSRSAVSARRCLSAAESVPAAKAAKLVRRECNTEGRAELEDDGHGLTVGQRIDIYFPGGLLFDAEVTEVDGAVIRFASDAGDPLPSDVGAALAVAVPVVAGLAIHGPEVVGLAVRSSSKAAAVVAFVERGGAIEDAIDLAAEEGTAWTSARGGANPLRGAHIAAVRFSHADTNRPAGMRAAVLGK